MLRKHQVSAGLLAFRRKPLLEVLLAHPGGPFWAKRDDGAWTIPKGVVEAGGDLLEGAKREFNEETGFQAHGPFIPIGAVRQNSGKTVHGFAFEGNFDPRRFHSNRFELEWPPKSGKRKSFPEIDRVGWFGEHEALAKIIGYQRPFLAALKTALG
jgi:predicted NUDIX family NTP pyrophosphohydrolase